MGIIAVVGLPGSGKTNVMKRRKGVIVIDDMGDGLTWGDGAWGKTKALARHCIRHGFNVIVSDVGFCKEQTRQHFRSEFPEVKWEFFDNNKEACINNVKIRQVKESRTHSLEATLASIEQYSSEYAPIDPIHKCFVSTTE